MKTKWRVTVEGRQVHKGASWPRALDHVAAETLTLWRHTDPDNVKPLVECGLSGFIINTWGKI